MRTISSAFLRTPLRFEHSNPGELGDTDFVARGMGYAVYLSGGDATVVLKPAAAPRPQIIRMRLAGRQSGGAVTGLDELPGRSNHLIGKDSRKWRTGVRSYAKVAYEDVYPGVDLVYYGNQQQLEYDFVVSPAASPSQIGFEIEGADGIAIDAQGNLVLTTGTGTLTHRAPVVYQEIDGVRHAVDGRYVIRKNRRVGFSVGRYDKRLPLVIDPVLNYSTYLGGSNMERIHGVAVDSTDHIVVAGETVSSDFPTVNAVQPQLRNLTDAFVARLTPAGDALVYATYLGGFHQDSATAVQVDGAGAAYVVGETFSMDFPTLNPLQANNSGQSDAFLAKLDASGSLVYSTLLGGFLEDSARGIAVDGQGRAHVVGSTRSANFPVQNALQGSLGGYPIFRTTNGGDTWTGQVNGLRSSDVTAFAFDPANPETLYAGTHQEGVFKTMDAGNTWTPTGELPPLPVYSLVVANGPSPAVYAGTLFGVYRSLDGGDSWTQLGLTGWFTALAVSPADPSTVYAALSPNGFPAGVFKTTDGGETWTDTGLPEGAISLAVSGSTLYAGTVNSGVFTNSGSGWVPANTGLAMEATVLVADPTNPAVAYVGNFQGLFKTSNGGVSWEPDPVLFGLPIGAIAVAPSDPSTLYTFGWGVGVVATNDGGATWRQSFSDATFIYSFAIHPQLSTVAFFGSALNRDAFVATFSANGSTLEYSTFFGGSGHEEGTDIVLGPDGARYLVGTTTSTDLPVLHALQSAFSGLQDAFAARLHADGSLGYATYLGGFGYESSTKVAVDSASQAHVAGLTTSLNYPTVNAHQPQNGGNIDVFVSVLTGPGDGFVYSTYLGGSNLDSNSLQSSGPDVDVAATGETYVTGTTMSPNFPTTPDALQRVHAGQGDAFLTMFNPNGVVQYSTLLGSTGDDIARGIALDAQGAVIVTGYTGSTNFPTLAGLQPLNNGTDDGFIARFGPGSAPSDTIPPVTTIALTGTIGFAGWYRSPVSVILSASDNESGSGVAFTQYRINGGPLQTYTGPFIVSTQGTTIVTAHSTDFAGNVEVPSSATTIRIDSVAPALGIASPQAREYLPTQSAAVSISVSDAVSGVAGPVSMTLDGAPFAGSTVDMSTLALGPHTLAASATDIAGNTGQSSVTFHVVAELDTVIEVPREAPTIQAAIDAATNGFTVLVAPGAYFERINFRGKTITVKSAQGPDVTIIDGGGQGRVVTFMSRETRAAVLSGFTIRNGFDQSGAGIGIGSSSPTIRGNVITGNRGCSGVGIESNFGSPLIQGNRITRNSTETCTGGWGIGVRIGGDSAAEIVDNEITENTSLGSTFGGGIALFAAGNVTVSGNVIARNTTEGPWGCGWGGGLISANFAQAKVFNNLIAGNRACFSGGVEWGGTTGTNLLVNNTIVGNEASIRNSGVYVSGFDARQQVFNNIIAVASGPALFCENAPGVSSPVLNSNNLYSAQGAAYGGTCVDQTGINGNVSADPRFVNAAAGDYRLSMASASIDTGNPAAPVLPPTDLAGGSRVVDGDGDGMPRVDMGALEYRNRAPAADAGADQTHVAGPDCSVGVTLNGTGSDADGDTLSFTWTGSFGTVSGASPLLTLPAGTHVITLTVADPNGGSASDTVVVSVVDDVPPTIGPITATPSVLSKPNHKMVPVVIDVVATDACGANVSCRIVSVTSNEPVNGPDDGDTAPDWEIVDNLTVTLRAERSNSGTGRVYTIAVACADPSGNTTTSTVTVTVPR